MVFTEHVKIREEKFGAVLFETLRERVFVSNETGKNILELIKKGYSQEKIVDVLAGEYGVEPLDIKKDVFDFIIQLEDSHIIQ